MRPARDVPTPLLWRKNMIFPNHPLFAQPAMIRSARFGPMPVTSRRRRGSCSMVSNTASPKAQTSFFQDRADAVAHTGAEIFLDALGRRRQHLLEKRGSKLDAMRAVVLPLPARLDELRAEIIAALAKHGDQITLTTRLHPQ
jgi:hypothetical protein